MEGQPLEVFLNYVTFNDVKNWSYVLWLVVNEGGSIPSLVVLSLAIFLLLSTLAYVKNRLLATISQPEHISVQEDNFMSKTKTYVSLSIASIFEVLLTLGASQPSMVEPLTKAH
jgi:hypothetical protein